MLKNHKIQIFDVFKLIIQNKFSSIFLTNINNTRYLEIFRTFLVQIHVQGNALKIF